MTLKEKRVGPAGPIMVNSSVVAHLNYHTKSPFSASQRIFLLIVIAVDFVVCCTYVVPPLDIGTTNQLYRTHGDYRYPCLTQEQRAR